MVFPYDVRRDLPADICGVHHARISGFSIHGPVEFKWYFLYIVHLPEMHEFSVYARISQIYDVLVERLLFEFVVFAQKAIKPV